MRINAIGTDYSSARLREKTNPDIDNTNAVGLETKQLNNGMSMISFKSGNPRHVAHVVAEEPLFGMKNGGVGTVSHDYNFLDRNVDKIVKFIPLYNQEVIYKKDVDPNTGELKGTLAQDVKVRYIPNNLPADHPFKGKEGMPFITKQTIGVKDDLAKILKDNANDIFLLEEVSSSQMDWGTEKNVPIKLFRACKDGSLEKAMNKSQMSKELQNKLEFVFVYVDSTASMPKPYGDGSYATAAGDDIAKRFASGWKGQEYAKFNKALVEQLPAFSQKTNIDPRYLLCSDGQSMFTMHYAAQKNAAGDSYFQDKFLGGVGHNMNRGYIQEMGARQAIVNLGATKEDIEKIINSKKYIEALKLGEEEKFLRETVLKNFYDAKGGMSAYNIPIHYAKAGYVPMLTTVSEGYHDSIITNELVSPLYESLKELDTLGRFKGLTNVMMDPTVSGFTEDGLQDGFKKDVKLKLADGTEKNINKFRIFDTSQKYDLSHIRDVKKFNKINLLERFNPELAGAQFWDAKKGEWGKAGSGQMAILTGAPNREAKIYGEISKDYINKLNNGKDIKLIVSWGRGDFQKGMDTVIDSFQKYAAKDPDAVLIFGGDMQYEKSTVEKFKSLMNDPLLKGRMVLMDGFAPGKDFACAADVALLPSRFAPCELTDLEAKKYLCTPVVPNVQGMAQKNFDPEVEADVKLMDAYKGKHEYFMTEEEALKAANEKAKTEFTQAKEKISKEISKKFTLQTGEEIPADYLKKCIEGNDKYNDALKNLRDSVISDEMAECLERALIKDRNTDIAKQILKNQVDADTTWFGNGWLSKTGKSSGELYWDWHFNSKNGKNISDKDVIKLDLSDLGEQVNNGNGTKTKKSFMEKLSKWAKSKSGKWTLGIAGGAAIVSGLGYVGYKTGWLNPKFVDEKKPGELSCIG